GVRHGASARVLAAACDEVHGFDSFAGLPEAWQGMPPGAFSLEGRAPPLPPNVVLHVGPFSETAPAFARALRAPVRFAHVDSDLYASAATALDAIADRLGPGAVVLFDEYLGNARWRDDEHRALAEASAKFGWTTEVVSRSWVTGQAAFRVTRGA
ncbi:MAG: class I SAM-dependent methyltransferase, partial [Polyangiales bacterium]